MNKLISSKAMGWISHILNIGMLVWLMKKFNWVESSVIFLVLMMANYLHGLIKGNEIK